MADITYTNTTDPDMKIDINFSSSNKFFHISPIVMILRL